MVIQSSFAGTLNLRLLGTWAVLHGFLVMMNDKERWSTPVFSTVNLLPGSPPTWGVLFVIAGLLIMWASLKGVGLDLPVFGDADYRSYRILKNTGLMIIAITSFLFALGVIVAAFQYPGLVSFSAADRDIYIGVAAILLMKIVEPRYTSNATSK